MNDDKRQRRRQQWRDWRARNKEKLRAKRQKKKLESLPNIKSTGYQIVGLSDPHGTTKQIRFLFIKHTNKPSPWRELFSICNKIDSELCEWFRDLRAARVEPVESVLLGSVPLNEQTAIRLLKALTTSMRPSISESHQKRRKRPIVCYSEAEGLIGYQSIAAACETLGRSRQVVERRLALMGGIYDGKVRL